MSLKPSEAWKLWKALYKSIGARDLLEILLKNHDKEQVTVQLVNKLTAGIQQLLPVSESRAFEATKPGSRLLEPLEEVLKKPAIDNFGSSLWMPFGAEELRNPFWQPGEDHIASSYDCVSKLGKRELRQELKVAAEISEDQAAMLAALRQLLPESLRRCHRYAHGELVDENERRRGGATKPTKLLGNDDKADSLAAVSDAPKRIGTTSIGDTSVQQEGRQPPRPQPLIDKGGGSQRPEDESHAGVEPAQRRVSGRSGARTKYPSDGSDVQIRATLPAAPRAAEILPKATSAEVDKAATGKTTKKQTRLKTSTQRAGAGGTSDSCEGRTRMDDPTNAEKRIFKNNTRRTCNWDNIASAIEALLPRGEEFSFDSSWGDLGTLYKVWAKEHTYEGNRDKMLCADSNWKPSKGEIEAKYEEYKKSAAPKIRNDLQSIEEALDLPQEYLVARRKNASC
ncbi:hypothetical protein MGU_10807 [Metarhizium guizhouense ARSEF 977]|uniref:Uncharacterized protein n=2 Tax=Metarhizium TaxID=5529 RepID=A0A0B4GH97_METGA|nr:hypothetical protein MGU_10807 [Metarhizium guizhouense ARSEF 977]